MAELKKSWLSQGFKENHRDVMQWPPWQLRILEKGPDNRELSEIVVDFLNCNSGKGFSLVVLQDHIEALKRQAIDYDKFRKILSVLLKKKKISKVGKFYTSVKEYLS